MAMTDLVLCQRLRKYLQAKRARQDDCLWPLDMVMIDLVPHYGGGMYLHMLSLLDMTLPWARMHHKVVRHYLQSCQ